MGGAIAEGNVTPAAEFNIWGDPEAAARVFASDIDVTMIGLDVTHKALFTQAHIGRLGRPVGEMVTELLRSTTASIAASTTSTARRSTTRSPSRTSSVPISSRRKQRNVEIDTSPSSAAAAPSSTSGGRAEREPNAHVGVEVDADGFLELLVERINSLQ